MIDMRESFRLVVWRNDEAMEIDEGLDSKVSISRVEELPLPYESKAPFQTHPCAFLPSIPHDAGIQSDKL